MNGHLIPMNTTIYRTESHDYEAIHKIFAGPKVIRR